ncbi:MAG: hydantoinase B/oxoprolinase family protein, partial [Actinomycetota bacterium]
HEPSRFTLVAAGGAGPMHGAAVAAGRGVERVYVPRDAGALCAVGMLNAELRQDFVRFLRGAIDDIDPARVAGTVGELQDQARAALAAEGVAAEEVQLRTELDLHHPGQLWSLKVAVDEFDPVAVRAQFEADYQRLYGHVQDQGTIMIASARVVATASTGSMNTAKVSADAGAVAPIESRKVWHGTHGWLDTDVFDGRHLGPGWTAPGPLLVEEATTTVVVGPTDAVAVDEGGNFELSCPPPSTPSQVAAPATATVEPVRSEGSAPSSQEGDVDPITLSLMQNRLDQISRHMGWVMTRTARSTIFSQSHDFSCFITTPDGTLAANADGVPIHTGGGGFAVRALLARWGDDIADGDVFLLSDPYVAGGNHLPDWVIARPIFVDDRIVGFCCNRAHQSDIGGGLAGTYNPEATEIWHEGIRLPVLKLISSSSHRSSLVRPCSIS